MNQRRIQAARYAAIVGGEVDGLFVTAKETACLPDGDQFVVVHNKKPRCNHLIDVARFRTAVRCLKLNCGPLKLRTSLD